MPQLAPSSSRRLRSRRANLPWDVLLLVLQQADPSTLAVLGRVSFDFFVTTSGHLYKDVEVTSFKQLERLFCERKQSKEASSSSRINSHLNLSRIRTLSLDLPSSSSIGPFQPLRLSSSRMAGLISLPLNSFRLSFYHGDRLLVPRPLKTLFPVLNPVRLEHRVRDRPSGWGPLYDAVGSYIPEGWTRLEMVVSRGGIPFGPWLRFRNPVRVRFDLPSLLTTDRQTIKEVAGNLISSYIISSVLCSEQHDQPARSVVLVVDSKGEEDEAIAVVQECEERWRSAFSVEIEVEE